MQCFILEILGKCHAASLLYCPNTLILRDFYKFLSKVVRKGSFPKNGE